jgi:membrane protein required for beta-lactamase induction
VRRPSFGTIFLGLIPFLAMCFSVSAWDRVHPMVLGVPFNLFWLLSWIVLTSVCIGAMYRLEASRTSKASERRHNENQS